MKKAISTKINKLSDETKISSEYLNILRRELGTFDKKGILFKDFPIVNNDTIKKLDENGIKNTKYFYECYYKENNEKKYYKAKLGLKDMQFIIDYANLIKYF